jgi:tyrosyl-tRNA synthetase
MNILDELQWRGLFADCTDVTELTKRLAASPITLYCGFDPTADSLHVGHLVPLLALRRFQNYGHHPIAVAGGATGSIGDPSGKSAERSLLTKEQIQANVEAVRPQLAKFLDFERAGNPARLVDNADWTAQLTYLDFLRDIGKHFSVNQMVAKESVRARMEDREVGISYTEFSYMLLQAFDYMVLARDLNCELQIGGSDQWGNITAGMDLIRKKLQRSAFGLTLPLITKADGTKFGKTEGGSVWLDPKKTSVYRFYQFWINTADADVIRYLKFFTFLPQEEIERLEAKHAENPGARWAQHALANEATNLIHGEQAMVQAQVSSNVLFGGSLEKLSENDFADIIGEIPTKEIEKTKLDGAGLPLVELLVHAGLSQSKGQARKDVEGGGVNINNVREVNFQRAVTSNDLLFGKHVLLRKGKKNYVVVTAK